VSARPVGYKRRADFNDFLFEAKLGVVEQELTWARADSDAELIRTLQIEVDTLRRAAAVFTPKLRPDGWKLWDPETAVNQPQPRRER
jgi:hypothetical protein